MRSPSSKFLVMFGAVATMVGCGPVDEAEQAGVEAQVADARNCGAEEISAEQQAQIESRFELLKAKQAMGGVVTAQGASIPVYVHVIRDSSGLGGVTTTQINNQITVL